MFLCPRFLLMNQLTSFRRLREVQSYSTFNFLITTWLWSSLALASMISIQKSLTMNISFPVRRWVTSVLLNSVRMDCGVERGSPRLAALKLRCVTSTTETPKLSVWPISRSYNPSSQVNRALLYRALLLDSKPSRKKFLETSLSESPTVSLLHSSNSLFARMTFLSLSNSSIPPSLTRTLTLPMFLMKVLLHLHPLLPQT